MLGSAAAAWPVTVRAQQPSVRRIGILSPLSPPAAASRSFEIFRKTLLDLGYVDGRSISLEYPWAESTAFGIAQRPDQISAAVPF